MKSLPRFAAGLALLGSALTLAGCASPNIVLDPQIPAPPSAGEVGRSGTVALRVEEAAARAPSGAYEERSDKTLIGTSESLGMHLSDLWLAQAPSEFVARLLRHDLEQWGYGIAAGSGRTTVEARVNRLSLESRAANPVQFEANGVIDADVDVVRADGSPAYKGHYVATCTRRTATEMPSQAYLSKVFDGCVADFQGQIASDAKLRSALAGAPGSAASSLAP